MTEIGFKSFSTFDLRMYQYQGILIFEFQSQIYNDNGNDFIQEYFITSDYMNEYKFPIYNMEQHQCIGQQGKFLKNIGQLSSLQFIKIYQQLLKSIMLFHKQKVLAACLTDDNVYFDHDNNKIFFLEFGFLPRLPTFINDYDPNMDLKLIKEIMNKLEKKLKQPDNDCKQILNNLANCNTYYDLFNQQNLDSLLKEEGKKFYNQQYQFYLPGISQNILKYQQGELLTLESIKQLLHDQTTTGNYYHQIDNLIQFFFNTFICVSQTFPENKNFLILLHKLIYLLFNNLLQEIQNGEPTYYSFDQKQWQQYLNSQYDDKITYKEKIISSIKEQQQQVSEQQANLNPNKYSSFNIKQEENSDFPSKLKQIIIEQFLKWRGNQNFSLKIEVSLLLCLAFFYKGYKQINKILHQHADLFSINAVEIVKNQSILKIIEDLRILMKIKNQLKQNSFQMIV